MTGDRRTESEREIAGRTRATYLSGEEAVAPPLSDVDAVFLDLDGCLWFGERLADGATALVEGLRRSGRKVAFLTNTSNRRAAQVAAKLCDLGVEAAEADVILPLEALAAHPWLGSRPQVWFLGPSVVRGLVGELATLAATPEDAELLVLGRDPEMTYDDLADALQVLVRGGRMLALNVDPRVPVENGRMLPGTGAVAAALTYASGVRPEVVGKPSQAFFDTALRRLAATPERSVIVGDTLDADVAGGAAAGMRTVLVGDASPSSCDPAPVPDFWVPDLDAVRMLILGAPGGGVTVG